MTLTRTDVADLREGDVVELTLQSGSSIRGALISAAYRDGLAIDQAGWTVRFGTGDQAGWTVRFGTGDPVQHPAIISLAVISRAPRSIYTNAERAEPTVGDVVRDADEGRDTRFWMWCEDGTWASSTGVWRDRDDLPKNLLLILDGETGEPPA